jgi:hypothetical protein
MTLQEIREQGIGSNFKVANQADGYRKDNRLWFGTCTSCGERVTNSSLNGEWMHDVVYNITYHEDGKTVLSRSTKQINYCPDFEVDPETI